MTLLWVMCGSRHWEHSRGPRACTLKKLLVDLREPNAGDNETLLGGTERYGRKASREDRTQHGRKAGFYTKWGEGTAEKTQAQNKEEEEGQCVPRKLQSTNSSK